MEGCSNILHLISKSLTRFCSTLQSNIKRSRLMGKRKLTYKSFDSLDDFHSGITGAINEIGRPRFSWVMQCYHKDYITCKIDKISGLALIGYFPLHISQWFFNAFTKSFQTERYVPPCSPFL